MEKSVKITLAVVALVFVGLVSTLVWAVSGVVSHFTAEQDASVSLVAETEVKSNQDMTVAFYPLSGKWFVLDDNGIPMYEVVRLGENEFERAQAPAPNLDALDVSV